MQRIISSINFARLPVVISFAVCLLDDKNNNSQLFKMAEDHILGLNYEAVGFKLWRGDCV